MISLNQIWQLDQSIVEDELQKYGITIFDSISNRIKYSQLHRSKLSKKEQKMVDDYEFEDIFSNLNFENALEYFSESKVTIYKKAKDEWSRSWFQFILDHPDKKWIYSPLSSNLNITWQIVQDNPDKPWNYSCLSFNPNITWQIVQDNPDIPWVYYWLSYNPNITWQIVQDNPDIPWDYSELSSNPNITWQIVQDNINKPWNYSGLSSNSSKKEREEFIETYMKNFMRKYVLLKVVEKRFLHYMADYADIEAELDQDFS